MQIENLKEFARQKGLEVIKIIVETGSGLNLNHESLNEIMKIAQSKEADMILTRDISRISWSDLYNLEFIHEKKAS